MAQSQTLIFWDWVTIAVFLTGIVIVSLSFTKRGGKDMASYFVSDRSLPWFVAGVSIVATNFASDTPLWVSALVRQAGIHTIWQYWAPMIGGCLCAVLFSRLWRRMGVITDIEFLELRYQGKSASILRFWLGAVGSIIICPLIISWVTKAMATITQEVLGLPPEYQGWITGGVLCVALITCVFSGLYGVVYTDFIQFFAAWLCTIVLAILAVRQVGGVSAMIDQLHNMQNWSGKELEIFPQVGPRDEGKLSIWNIILFFGVWWFQFSIGGHHVTQRLLACKDSRHSSYAHMLYIFMYFAVLAWPWILVGLCSLILIPNLGEGVSQDHAYPRMIVQVMPVGLRGLLVAALISAFISTSNSIFNWGSSYLVNDVYKRFMVKDGSSRHYVMISRIATIILAVIAGILSQKAKSIQDLLEIFFVMNGAMAILCFLRWFWPRLNAQGELAASVVSLIFAPILLFGAADDLARKVLHLPEGAKFHEGYDYMGARVIVMLIIATAAGIIGSLLTRPVDDEHLAGFVRKARPLKFFWRRIINRHGIEYAQVETPGRTLVSWAMLVISVLSLMIGIGKLILGPTWLGWLCLAVFGITLAVTLIRIRKDFSTETEAPKQL
jgi:solute:Na+ symporter, SSS family